MGADLDNPSSQGDAHLKQQIRRRSATSSRFTPTRFVAEDDTVVATGTSPWKHRTTGKPAVVQMAHIWTFRDGKVISMHQHVDTLKVQELSA
jgi:ketosteroid isomerase-like protein